MTNPATTSLLDRANLDRDQVRNELARGLAGADDGELFLEYSQTEALMFDNGRLKQATYDTSQGFGLRAVKETIVAPLDVTLDAGRVHVRAHLGDGGANGFAVRVPAGVKLHVVARPVAPKRLLTPPRRLLSGAVILRTASLARMSVARELQYAQFLPNPDSLGTSTATYVYDTAAATIPLPRAIPRRHHTIPAPEQSRECELRSATAPHRPAGGAYQGQRCASQQNWLAKRHCGSFASD